MGIEVRPREFIIHQFVRPTFHLELSQLAPICDADEKNQRGIVYLKDGDVIVR